MRNIDDIIFAVFNEDELNSQEEILLKQVNSDIYNFYNGNIEFQTELLKGLNVTLQNRIKDIKTFSTCKECRKKYNIRYKYRPYSGCDDIEFCDECIKNFSLDYVALRELEKHLRLANEEYMKIITFNNKNFNKLTGILNDVILKRQEIGKWISEYSNNYSNRIDKVSAYYEIDDNTVYITNNTDKDKMLTDIGYIKQFEPLKVKYDSDCKNIELRYEDYCKRPYTISKKGSYNWIVPNGMTLKLDNCYGGDYENSEFHFE